MNLCDTLVMATSNKFDVWTIATLLSDYRVLMSHRRLDKAEKIAVDMSNARERKRIWQARCETRYDSRQNCAVCAAKQVPGFTQWRMNTNRLSNPHSTLYITLEILDFHTSSMEKNLLNQCYCVKIYQHRIEFCHHYIRLFVKDVSRERCLQSWLKKNH